MKKICTTLIMLTLAINLVAQSNKCLFQYTEDTLYSDILQENRMLLIYTPDGYNPGRSYPILYVLDGEYLFGYSVSMTRYLYDCELIPELIVVGIKNVNRNRDFLPSNDLNIPESGGAQKFAKVLTMEIVPYVNSKFGTSGYKILYGHSYGGLFTQYIFANYAGFFNSYIAASPSVYWNNNMVIDQINNLEPVFDKWVCNYFTIGSYERDQMVGGTAKLDSVFKNKVFENLDFMYKYMEGEDHATTRLKTLNDGLEFIFKKWYFPFKGDKSNWDLDSLNSYYNDLSDLIGVKIKPFETLYYYIAYYHLRQGNNNEAFKTFYDASKNYPDSPKSYTNLGMAYERTGDTANAIKYYKMALNKTDTENVFYKEIQAKIEKINMKE